MATTYLGRTQGTATLRTKCTLSVWIKRGNLSNGGYQFFVSSYNSGSDRMGFYFNTGDTLDIYSPNYHVQTSRLFRDPNAWYHVVYRVDTTQGNVSDRIRIYVNGEQQTSLGIANYPTQNYNLEFGTSSYNMYIGNYDNNQHYFDGCMSHLHFLDGEDRDASYFGETDSTTGEWKIKTNVTGVNYGNQGFHLFKDNNSTSDQSTNSNNFTVYTGASGTLTKTEDNPSNVFATLNPLDNYFANSTFSNGNNNVVFNNSNECFNTSTLGMSSGKFYFEGKQISRGNTTSERNYFGVTYSSPDASSDWLGNNNYSWGYRGDGKVYNSGQLQATYSSFTNGDIIGVALDVTNSKLYFSKNGVWQNSADPANGTNGLSVNAGKTYFFAVGETTGASGVESATNFGNGYFKTTAVSSAGTNASGNGIFEYDVPTGFTALSTKGLNE